MAEEKVLTSNSSNSSDTEETCQQYALKMEEKTPACKTDKLSPPAGGDGATADVSTAESHGECAATATGLAEGLDLLLQKQRRDLMLELSKLQTGHRPVTSTESRETLEEFFTGREGGERQTTSRPQSIVSEVQGLSERQPVSSVLRSNAFRRNLEDVIRGTLVRQDRELQQTIRLRSAGFNVGATRPVPVQPSTFQQHLESLSQLSHSSRTSTSSQPSLGMADIFSPPPPPPPVPQQGQPVHYQQQQQPQQFPSMQSFPSSQWRPQQQHMSPNPYQQQQPWQQQQQQYSQWQQQQQQQQQQQAWQQPQPWQQPVQPQQPWLMQNSAQQANSNINMMSYLQQANREDAVFEISNLVQRQLVSSMLNSDFRGTLENTMMAHLQNTEADGQSVANFIQSLPQSQPHRRNDFSHLGIQAPSREQAMAASSSRSTALAAPELDTLRRQMEEMQTMMRLTFELQLDMQRSIRQEVAAALSGQHGQVVSTHSVQAPMPPSQPASEGNCVICLEKSVDAVLYQCGHMCCCLACGLRLKGMGSHCPMCRAPIRDVIRAYRCQRE